MEPLRGSWVIVVNTWVASLRDLPGANLFNASGIDGGPGALRAELERQQAARSPEGWAALFSVLTIWEFGWLLLALRTRLNWPQVAVVQKVGRGLFSTYNYRLGGAR